MSWHIFSLKPAPVGIESHPTARNGVAPVSISELLMRIAVTSCHSRLNGIGGDIFIFARIVAAVSPGRARCDEHRPVLPVVVLSIADATIRVSGCGNRAEQASEFGQGTAVLKPPRRLQRAVPCFHPLLRRKMLPHVQERVPPLSS
jgi:hypothetical protein